MATTKRVNRTDLTLRNLRAMKKQIAAHEKRIAKLERFAAKGAKALAEAFIRDAAERGLLRGPVLD